MPQLARGLLPYPSIRPRSSGYYSMDNPKSEPADATVADISSDWCRQALPVGLLVAVGSLYAVGLSRGAFQGLPTCAKLWIALLPVHIAAFGAVLWVCWTRVPRGQRIRALFLTPVDLGTRWWWLALAIPLLYAAMAFLTLLIALILVRAGYTPHGNPLLRLLQTGEALTPLSAVSLFAGIVLIVPVAEEILFRVVLFEALRELGVTRAALASAAVFAAGHMIPEQFAALFFLGLVLQFLRLRTGSLLPCILVHAGINTIGLVALLLTVL